ncbi:MAG: hypothetical protein M3R39_03435 [Actinomycetota bacterium]|nr:hypothetical protein [Actinomycetota bacterium]
MKAVVGQVGQPPLEVLSLELEDGEVVSDVDGMSFEAEAARVERGTGGEQVSGLALDAWPESNRDGDPFHEAIVARACVRAIGTIADLARGELRIPCESIPCGKAARRLGDGPDAVLSGERHGPAMSSSRSIPCRFQETLGVAEECPQESCPFWQPGGVVLDGRCAFERLDLAGRADLAAFLLRIRDDLRTGRAPRSSSEARLLFFQRLNERDE